MIRTQLFTALVLFSVLLAACQTRENSSSQEDSHDMTSSEMEPSLLAELAPTQGNTAAGVVSFTKTADGVLVTAHITGLPPGKHGFHIHEKGDCSAPDGSSAGGHFNPDGTPHGAPSNSRDKRHVGDLGNIEAGASGTAHFETVDHVISLEGPASISGKAVIVHAGEDDFTTQPTGGAGARLACGVISASE